MRSIAKNNIKSFMTTSHTMWSHPDWWREQDFWTPVMTSVVQVWPEDPTSDLTLVTHLSMNWKSLVTFEIKNTPFVKSFKSCLFELLINLSHYIIGKSDHVQIWINIFNRYVKLKNTYAWIVYFKQNIWVTNWQN